jgi:hypothetical protein
MLREIERGLVDLPEAGQGECEAPGAGMSAWPALSPSPRDYFHQLQREVNEVGAISAIGAISAMSSLRPVHTH